jgi:hypothetical protein
MYDTVEQAIQRLLEELSKMEEVYEKPV